MIVILAEAPAGPSGVIAAQDGRCVGGVLDGAPGASGLVECEGLEVKGAYGFAQAYESRHAR